MIIHYKAEAVLAGVKTEGDIVVTEEKLEAYEAKRFEMGYEKDDPDLVGYFVDDYVNTQDNYTYTVIEYEIVS